MVETLRISLYEKSQATTADVTEYDMGNRVRRYYGTGGFGNVTVATPEVESARKHSRMLRPFL